MSLANQTASAGVTEISRHNRDSLMRDADNENMFFALGSKKPKPQPAEEDFMEDDEEDIFRPHKGRKPHHRT